LSGHERAFWGRMKRGKKLEEIIGAAKARALRLREAERHIQEFREVKLK